MYHHVLSLSTIWKCNFYAIKNDPRSWLSDIIHVSIFILPSPSIIYHHNPSIHPPARPPAHPPTHPIIIITSSSSSSSSLSLSSSSSSLSLSSSSSSSSLSSSSSSSSSSTIHYKSLMTIYIMYHHFLLLFSIVIWVWIKTYRNLSNTFKN